MNTRLLFKRALLSAIAPAAFALAASQPADAKIVILGNDPQGWEFSTDGSVNGFLVNDHPEALKGGDPLIGTHTAIAGPITSGLTDQSASSTRIRVGLLPTVFGFNVRSPDLDGIVLGSRIGIYPNIQNGGGAVGRSGTGYNGLNEGNRVDLREAFFTADAKWGQLLVGRELDQFLADNILSDMTLFGVGATGSGVGNGGTTLGRIGYGYVYPNFNSQIRYTSPDLGGLKVSVGIYDPSRIAGTDASQASTLTAPIAAINSIPRLESAQDYVTKFGSTAVTLFASEMWAHARFDSGVKANVAGLGASGASLADKSVDSWGFGGGVKASFGSSFDAVISGYTGEGLGTTLIADVDALDGQGNVRTHNGYYIQGIYHFGQGTSLGASWGGSYADETAYDTAIRKAHLGSELESQELFVAQIYHDINKYFRLIAEYGHEDNGWFDGASKAGNTFSVGAFVFW